MKYIIMFLLLTTVLIADILEKNDGTSIVINHSESGLVFENQVVVFEYSDNNVKSITPEIINVVLTNITENNDISSIVPDKNGHYIIGVNSGIAKYTISGLQPERDFTIHFVKLDKNPAEYTGLIRSTTNSIEPQSNPNDFRFINTNKDQLTVDWTQSADADGSILIVSKDRIPQLPKDGEVYKSNTNYGTNYSVIDGITYALFVGKKTDEPIIIDNLQDDGEYYFQVFSYNGNKYFKNYNLELNYNNTFVYNKKGNNK